MPLHRPLTLERVYRKDGPPDYKLVFEYLYQQGALTKELAVKIMVEGGKLLEKEPNLLKI